MITYFLGAEETKAYARDLLSRLGNFQKFPTVWCPVTRSGIAILRVFTDLMEKEFPKMASKITVLSMEMEDGGKNIRFVGGKPAMLLRNKSVLLLDGAIHSGDTMAACAKKILAYEPRELSSYTLVLKRGSCFIPTLWGLMICETDRAFFLLEQIPNNRLDAAGHNGPSAKKQPMVHIERLSKQLVNHPPVKSGVSSMDRITWSDRHFQMLSTNYETCTYVLRRSKRNVGYLTMHRIGGGGLMVDEIVTDVNQQGHGFGGILMRFVDTLARQADAPVVRLLAIQNQVKFYLKFGFRYVDSEAPPVVLENERYFLMERVVLYHQSPVK